MTRPRILVVDDDAQFLRFVTELLPGAGYDARCIGDAFGALALAGDFVPELVIVDVSMPGRDGFELVKELGSSERTRGIPCLVVTGVPLREQDAAGPGGGGGRLPRSAGSERDLAARGKGHCWRPWTIDGRSRFGGLAIKAVASRS